MGAPIFSEEKDGRVPKARTTPLMAAAVKL
jgi:hypothetical protein